MQKHYIIGDVHGEYQTLLALIAKLPKDAKLIFVGDLIDRGSQSREVVAFVRENHHISVLGNHEALFCKYALEFLSYLEGKIAYEEINQQWHRSGRFESFLSYGLIEVSKEGVFRILDDSNAIERLKDDIAWMQKIPIFFELDTIHSSGKRVVVSHSNISKVWDIRHDRNNKKNRKEFVITTLWTREHEVNKEANIFNIFGHTPQKLKPEITEHYVNVDTGCFYLLENNLYGRLSAYCVESGEVVMQKNIKSIK